MFTKPRFFGGPLIGLVAALPLLLVTAPSPAWAGGDSGTEMLKRRLESLENEVKELRALIQQRGASGQTRRGQSGC